MIEKMEHYWGSTSTDGRCWIPRPNKDDFVDKINEIIDAIDTINKDYIKREDVLAILNEFDSEDDDNCCRGIITVIKNSIENNF